MNLRSPTPIRHMIDRERAAAQQAFAAGHDGWGHLERAHVLSQPWAFDHVAVHGAMLARAWREKDTVELRGQLVRLLVAGPGSAGRRYPVGNTGRARVPATAPMMITATDIRDALRAAGHPAD